MFEKRWFWCGQCDCPAIKCEHCNNTSCNGSGCDLCRADFEAVTAMINAGTAPAKKEMPYHPPVDWNNFPNVLSFDFGILTNYETFYDDNRQVRRPDSRNAEGESR